MLTDRHLVLLGMLLQFVLGGVFMYISSAPRARSDAIVVRGGVTIRRQPRAGRNYSCPQQLPASCAPPPPATTAASSAATTAERLETNIPLVDRNTFLLVLIATQPERVRERAVARETWMSRTEAYNDRLLIRFVMPVMEAEDVLSDEVLSEAMQFGDIAFLPGLKSGAGGRNLRSTLLWAYRNVNFKYYMKIDDTVYLSVSKIISMLVESEMGSADVRLWGSVLSLRDSRRHVIGKGNMWLWLFRDFTLPVVYPSGYILQRRVLEFVAGDEDEMLLRVFTDEALTLVGWLSMLNITYLPLKLYRPLENLRQPYCPRNADVFHLFEYRNVLAGFRNIHGCMSVGEAFAAERLRVERSDNFSAAVSAKSQGVRLHRKGNTRST